MFKVFSSAALTVLEVAQQEARDFNLEYLGTEVLLIGLTHVPSPALGLLRRHEIIPSTVRRLMLDIITPAPWDMKGQKLMYSERAQRLFRRANRETELQGSAEIEPLHLLAGLLYDPASIASHILCCCTAIDLNSLHKEVDVLLASRRPE